MADVHLSLICDFFRARPPVERTPETLKAIVTHVAIVYALGTDHEQALYAQARARLLPHPTPVGAGA